MQNPAEPRMSVCSEFSGIPGPVNPQRNVRARSIEKWRRLKCVLPFAD